MKFIEWLSQLANLILGGYPDESLSSRAARSEPAWAARIDRVCGAGHCAGVASATSRRQRNRWS